MFDTCGRGHAVRKWSMWIGQAMLFCCCGNAISEYFFGARRAKSAFPWQARIVPKLKFLWLCKNEKVTKTIQNHSLLYWIQAWRVTPAGREIWFENGPCEPARLCWPAVSLLRKRHFWQIFWVRRGQNRLWKVTKTTVFYIVDSSVTFDTGGRGNVVRKWSLWTGQAMLFRCCGSDISDNFWCEEDISFSMVSRLQRIPESCQNCRFSGCERTKRSPKPSKTIVLYTGLKRKWSLWTGQAIVSLLRKCHF